MAFEEAPLFSESVKRELPKSIVVIRPNVEELPDVIGQFSSDVTDAPPLLKVEVKELIEREFPGRCEFVPASIIWDDVFQREIDARSYFFVNIINYVDGWDHELSDIRTITRKDGSSYSTLRGMGVVNHQTAKDAHLWRDKYTKDVICSEEFKLCMEDLCVSNVQFYEIPSNI